MGLCLYMSYLDYVVLCLKKILSTKFFLKIFQNWVEMQAGMMTSSTRKNKTTSKIILMTSLSHLRNNSKIVRNNSKIVRNNSKIVRNSSKISDPRKSFDWWDFVSSMRMRVNQRHWEFSSPEFARVSNQERRSVLKTSRVPLTISLISCMMDLFGGKSSLVENSCFVNNK